MNREEIVGQILVYVKRLVKNDVQFDVTPETRILSEQVVDSLGIINLVTFIESKFNIKMEQSDLTLDNLDSVENIADYVVRKRQ